MTKRLIGIILTLVTIVLVALLSFPMGSTPALGKFLSTTHGFWKNIDPKPETNYTFIVKAPGGDVEVVYDERGIPHIFAQNNEDLYYAQGFVMAKDRLWQMDFISYVASGRLTEIVGEDALELDRYHRRIGLKRAADNSMKGLLEDKATAVAVNSFSDGINAYIESLSSAELPIEYKLMNYKPEAWEPVKCALLLKYMANDLTGYDTDIEYSNALKLFGKEAFDQMYPERAEVIDPIIPLETPFNFTPLLPKPLPNNDSTVLAGLYPNPIKEFLPPKGLGSNNWALGGAKTASGKPMLCNDPHLSLNLPSIWYEMQLSTPEMNVYGVTLPGSPGIVIGYNEHIAWGVTNGSMDVRDWYSVESNPANENQYKVNGSWKEYEIVEETFKIKGKEDLVEKIKWTVVGPIVYDASFSKTPEQKNLALSWLAHRPTNELRAFYGLNRAKNHNDYLKALDHYWCPAQNFVYADITNNIAIKEQGRFWVRHKEQGKFIQKLDNADLASIESHFIPNDQNPYVLNPSRGFVSSANQEPVGPNYPYYVHGQYENYRNRRINQVIQGMSGATIDDMKKLHYDNFSVLAQEILPSLLANVSQPTSGTAQKVAQSLSKWDFMTNFESEAATYFYVWWDYVEQLTWDELDRKDISLVRPENYNTASLIRNNPTFALFDKKKTGKIETAADIIQMAFDSTLAWVENNPDKTEFRMYKNTALTHMARLKAFSTEYIKIGGYGNIVNATSSRWGASVRLIVDFSEGKPQGYGMYPGGQSGNPGSAAYTAFADAWTDGKYYKHHFFKNLTEAKKLTQK